MKKYFALSVFLIVLDFMLASNLAWGSDEEYPVHQGQVASAGTDTKEDKKTELEAGVVADGLCRECAKNFYAKSLTYEPKKGPGKSDSKTSAPQNADGTKGTK